MAVDMNPEGQSTYENAVLMEELREQGAQNVQLRAEVRYWQGIANAYKAALDAQSHGHDHDHDHDHDHGDHTHTHDEPVPVSDAPDTE